MLIQKTDGTALDAFGNVVPKKLNTERVDHVAQAASRLIERWRADRNPNLAALQSSIVAEVQELEDAAWQVMLARMPDYAEGVQLDVLGRVVGQRREGLSDTAYRAHIKARIRINRSFGTPEDIIEVIKLVETAAFRFVEHPTAGFTVIFSTAPSASVGHELPSMVRDTRAAGVSGLVSMPVNATASRNALFGTKYAPLNLTNGWSSYYNNAVGGVYGHGARA